MSICKYYGCLIGSSKIKRHCVATNNVQCISRINPVENSKVGSVVFFFNVIYQHKLIPETLDFTISLAVKIGVILYQ